MKRKRKKISKYVQMPLSEFIQNYPEFVNSCPSDLQQLADEDDRYIVRFAFDANERLICEFGFESDKWYHFE